MNREISKRVTDSIRSVLANKRLFLDGLEIMVSKSPMWTHDEPDYDEEIVVKDGVMLVLFVHNVGRKVGDPKNETGIIFSAFGNAKVSFGDNPVIQIFLKYYKATFDIKTFEANRFKEAEKEVSRVQLSIF